MKFTEFNLNEKIQQGIDEAGFTECMPVQEQTFVHSFKGKDVYVQSQTGTGKTAAFLITIFNLFMDENYEKKKRALIVAPTRELAEQIGQEAELLGKYTGVRAGTFYGGVGYTKQESMLRDKFEIIIGTPGRLIDFMEQKKLNLKEFGVLVVDEADRLFDMGFLPDLKKMLKRMPSKDNRQSMLYSATLDYRVKQISSQWMNSAEEVEIEPEKITVENITQKLYHVGSDEKINLLLGILKTEDPKSAIIFTNTKVKAVDVAKRLEKNGYHCEYIISDLPQKQRQKIIDRVRMGKVPYLVATDVASRGLHIDDLEMVVNYDLPENTENYVHRIGRTARVGKSGKAISLVCNKYVYGLEAIEKFTKMKIPVEWADEDLYEEDEAAGIHFAMPKKGGAGAQRESRERERKGRGRSRPDERRTGERKAGARKPDDKKRPPRKTKGREDAAPKKQRLSNDKKRPASRKERDQIQPDINASRPPSGSSLDERLAYYSEKYGEDFIVVTEPVDMKKKERSSIKEKILGIFKRKK